MKNAENHHSHKNIIIAIVIVCLAIFIGIVLGGKWLQQDILSEMTKRFDKQNEQSKKIASLEKNSKNLYADWQTLRKLMTDQLDDLSQQDRTSADLLNQKKQIKQLGKQLNQLNADLLNQNKQIEQLGKQLNQLNTALLSLTEKTAHFVTQQAQQKTAFGNQLTQLEKSLKGDIAALAQAHNDKVASITAQWQTVTYGMANSIKKHTERLKKLDNQSAQLKTKLNSDIAKLSQAQNSKLEKLNSKLEKITAELHIGKGGTDTSIKQHTEQLEKLGKQSTRLETTLNERLKQSAQVETTLKGDIEMLVQDKNSKLAKLTTQLQTLKEETAALIKQQKELEKQSHQSAQQEDNLKKEIATKFTSLREELQTLTEKTTEKTIVLDKQPMSEELGNPSTQQEIILKGE